MILRSLEVPQTSTFPSITGLATAWRCDQLSGQIDYGGEAYAPMSFLLNLDFEIEAVIAISYHVLQHHANRLLSPDNKQ
jgi:hypothetical protein